MKHVKAQVNALGPDPEQPRKIFAEGEIAALCEDIRRRGMVMPIIVFTHAGKAVIVDGHRRWLAAKMAGLAEVNVIVLPERPSAAELRIMQWSFDFHRAPLNAIERSDLLVEIRKRTGWTVTQMASELSIKQSLLSKLLAYEKLALPVRNLLATGALDMERAFILSSLDHDGQVVMVKEFAQLSREQLRAKIKSNGKSSSVKTKRAVFALDGGASITFKGTDATLEELIERLGETLKRLKKGLSEGLDAVTVQRVFKNKAG